MSAHGAEALRKVVTDGQQGRVPLLILYRISQNSVRTHGSDTSISIGNTENGARKLRAQLG